MSKFKLVLVLFVVLFFSCNTAFAQHYIVIDDLVKICSYNKREDVRKLRDFLKTGNYTASKLYANSNVFGDSYGNRISTKIIDTKRNGFEVFYSIKNPSKALIKSYKDYLKKNYTNVGYNDRGDYIKEGKFLISIGTLNNKVSGHRLTITVKNNSAAAYPVAGIKINGINNVKITSFTNSLSILYLKKGQEYKLRASGSIFVGAFAGKSSPNGINGFEMYNYVKGFKHGSLLGKLGANGNWFLLGSQKTIIPKDNSHLYVKVNDLDPSNNSGYYTLGYTTNVKTETSTKTVSSHKCTVGDCQNGQGKMVYSNGDIYEGNFKNNLRDGDVGIYTWANGNEFIGKYKKGKRLDGIGIFTWRNSTRYKGRFINELMHGFGQLYYNTGEKYTGEFAKNKRHGKGKLYDKEGKLIYDGLWEQDKKVN